MTRSAFLIALLLACFGATAQTERAEPAVLMLWNRPIVTFRATVDGVSPAQRVENSRERIDEHLLSKLGGPVTTRATTIGELKGVVVMIGPSVAFGLVEGDVDRESSLTLEQAAARAADRLNAVLEAREQQQRPVVVARGIGLSLLALLAFMLFVRGVLAAREWAIRKIEERLQIREWVIGGINILPTLATVERASFRVLTWIMVGAVTYLVVIFILQAFPYSEPFGDRLGAYLRGRLGAMIVTFTHWLPNLLGIVAVIFVTRAVAVWISRLVSEVEHGVRTITWIGQTQARATRRIASGLVWILGLAVAYSLLPWSDSPVFQGMSIVLGLGASLASAGLVNQWISGVVVLYSRSFRIGDYVRIGAVEGYVTEMGPLATKLHTVRREEITVPNAVMTSDNLINYSKLGDEQGELLSVSIQIGYDVQWRQVEALLLQAASQTAGVRRDPQPRVLRWELSDFSILYQLHVRLASGQLRASARSELNSNILDAFTAAQVQIMTPHFEGQPAKPVIASLQ